MRKGPKHKPGTACDVWSVERKLWEERACETGVCSSSDTVLIPLETQMHSCFSKYPQLENPPLSSVSHPRFQSLSALPPRVLEVMHIKTAEYAWCCDLKSLSTTHHEFCMETGDGYSGIHTCGRNGSSGIKEKAVHKPCTLHFKMSNSTFSRSWKVSFCSEVHPFFRWLGKRVIA